jgi:DNA-binding winged helix-turn-helix (wHTH) protein
MPVLSAVVLMRVPMLSAGPPARLHIQTTGSVSLSVLVFDEYRLDAERRELRRGTELIVLEPKAFDLLAFLVRHRDRVVSKDDLLREVWNGRCVSDSAITTRINAVRRAVGDDGAAQRLVRTFARKGVRFVGEVTELSDQPEPRSDKPSIAVLPFEN